MNDLPYIFYNAQKMYLDTSDMSCEGERAHRRLCDFIWFNDRPPLNQNDSLKQITHTKDSDWSRVKRELLAKGWLEVGEYLLHRGAIKSLNESKFKYVETYNRACKMNKTEPLTVSAPDTVTGIVTYTVTTTVTLPVTHTVNAPQSQQQQQTDIATHTEADFAVEPPPGFPKSAEDAKLACAGIGCPEQFAIDQWNQAMSRCGRDHRDVPIRSWSHYLAGSWGFAKDRTNKEKTNANRPTHRPTAPDRNAGTYNAKPLSAAAKSKVL